MNVQEQIKVLKEQISASQELLTKLEDQIKKEQEFPQVEDDYWYVNGDVEVMLSVWYGDDYDNHRQAIGNMYKTKREAEFVVEKLKVEAELRKLSGPFEKGRFNHYMFLDTDGNHLKVNSLIYGQPQGTIYFESEEKAKQAIEAVGEERIKKYIFGVEE